MSKSAQKSSGTSCMKAGLSELFAAMAGLVYAGITPTREGHDTKEHPLADLAVRAACMSYDARTVLINKIHKREEVAVSLVDFLKKSDAVIAAYGQVILSNPHGEQTGGTVGDVRLHVLNILRRELTAESRPDDKIDKFIGSPEKPYKADYLPGASVQGIEQPPSDHKANKHSVAKDFLAQFALT